MKPKQRTISGKELLKQISELSGYRIYETQDILTALAQVIANNAKQGYNTTIKGIGTFKVKEGYSIRGKSNLTGEEYNTLTAKSLSLKIDSYMSNALNESEPKEQEFDTVWTELKQELNLTDEDLGDIEDE